MFVSTGSFVPRRASAARRAVSSVAVLGLSAAVVLAPALAPGQAQAAGPKPEKPSMAAAQPANGSAPLIAGQHAETPSGTEKPKAGREGEGIHVHGHWVIEVRNPDGTLAQRREFENALADGGNLLESLLLGTETPGAWTIILRDTSYPYYTFILDEPNATAQAASDQSICTASPTYYVCSTNFAVTAASGGGLTLMGNVAVPNTFPATVNLSQAVTGLESCPGIAVGVLSCPGPQLSGAPSAASPSACVATSAVNFNDLLFCAAGGNEFTAASLGSTVPVSPGQTVTVTVTISFSSGS